MLIKDEFSMTELRNALEDIEGCFPFVDKLPRMSTIWKEDLEYRAEHPETEETEGSCRYYATFEDTDQVLAVYTNGEEVVVAFEEAKVV